MAETPRHGDVVADTENGLQTVFCFEKLSATFGQFLLTVMKKLSATFGHFSPAAWHAGMKVFCL